MSDRRPRSTYFKTYLGDPLGVLVIDRLCLSPLQFGLIALGGALVVDAISFALVGGEVIALSGWTETWAYVVYLYVIFPAIVGAYVWVSLASAELFLGLRQSEALIASNEEYDRFTRGHRSSLEALYNRPGWAMASLAVVILVAVYYAFVYTAGWPRTLLLLRAVKVLVLYMPGWYAICQIVAREIVTIWGLRQVFRRFKVDPHPLHPDRCGGLRAINNYAVGFAYVIAVAGVGVGLMAWVTLRREGGLSPDTAVWVAAYVVLASLCFFLPPWTAHRAMAEAKHRLLSDISGQFQRDYAEATARLADDPVALRERVDKVQDLRALYELTDAFPVWPFDTATLRRFAVTLSAPLVPVVVELAIGIVSSALRSR
jgi:hypothetical protein